MRPPSRPLAIATGIALIVLPLLAWALKLMSIGWMIVIILMGPIVLLLAGYAVQIVIASQGFLSKRELFGPAGARATIAAWTTSTGAVLLGVFMPDGGDSDYGSTLQVWLGAYGERSEAVHAATDGLTGALALVAAVAWLGGFVWLAIEWIAGLARRSRAKRSA